jgi:predicted dehydrogenase
MSRPDGERPSDLKILIIGCGSIGCRHLGNLLELGVRDIVAFDPRADRRGQVAARFPGVGIVAEMDAAWASGPDAVVVASPTSLHLPQALDAATRGIHMFVEKPLADRVDEDLGRLLEVVREKELVTLVGCNMRFHPGPSLVKSLIDEGRLGHVHYAQVFAGSYLPDWHPEEDHRERYSGRRALGGGCVLDGIHEIDLARWYVGEVQAVAAMTAQVGDLGIDVEDLASLILLHAGGQHSEVHLDYVQRQYSRGCVVVGSEGTARWDWSDKAVRCYSAGERRNREEALPSNWDTNQMYLDEMAHFLECLAIRGICCNPLEEAARVTGIALAARESSATRSFVSTGILAHRAGST